MSILWNSSTSPTMTEILKRLERSAPTKSNVLILGESGTGKEVFARAIHSLSPRAHKPFVVVDCSALSPQIMESELYGHIRGAFTGAEKEKKGLCEEAHGGTLFFDEIGEIPIDLQGKLLRVLQESTIRKVGDTKTIPIDVRVIAATNRNLEDEVHRGKFRLDLFYRLNVVTITLPPLRKRREDIPQLAHQFLDRFSKLHSRDFESIEPEALHRLFAYDWPGNIRQLEHCLEQIVVMGHGRKVTLEALPSFLHENRISFSGPLTSITTEASDDWNLKERLSQIHAVTEADLIRRALKETDFNKSRASNLLGISRRSLIYKVQAYGIQPELKIESSDSLENDQKILKSF